MSRPNKRQRENARRQDIRAAVGSLPSDVAERRRVPLAGYEGLYEITRSGEVYSVRAGRFIQHRYYQGPGYIQFSVDGEKVILNVQDAVTASWGDVPPMLLRVQVAGETLLVYVMDGADARDVAAMAIAEMIRDGAIPMTATRITSPAEVPSDWQDGIPWSPRDLNEEQYTIRNLIDLRRVALEQA